MYDIGDYERSLDLVLEAAGYAELRAEQARRREAGEVHLLGIGLSIYVEVTAGTGGSEHARIEVRPDGRATVFTGTSPHGQGHATAWSMLASAELGIPMDDIDVVHGDTDLIATGGGTSGSRSLQLGGSAVAAASKADGRGGPRGRGPAARGGRGGRRARHRSGRVPRRRRAVGDQGVVRGRDRRPAPTASSWPATSRPRARPSRSVRTSRWSTSTPRPARCASNGSIAVDDAGRILNPLLVDGQRHGGLAQGAAQALYEQMVYDEDGNPTTSTFAEYAIVSAAELPTFELVAQETPTPLNPLGAKGIGESGTIGSTPAVQNAVVDALAHLGVRHIDMPCTPERVWRAIRDAAG